jgi:hypothetical protein
MTEAELEALCWEIKGKYPHLDQGGADGKLFSHVLQALNGEHIPQKRIRECLDRLKKVPEKQARLEMVLACDLGPRDVEWHESAEKVLALYESLTDAEMQAFEALNSESVEKLVRLWNAVGRVEPQPGKILRRLFNWKTVEFQPPVPYEPETDKTLKQFVIEPSPDHDDSR